MPGNAGFTKSDGAGGVIQQQRRMAGARKNHAQRVRAEAAIFAAERGDHHVANHVYEMDRDHSGGGALFRPVADAANMMRIAQRHGGHTVLFRLLNTDLHGFMGHDLAEAAVAVQRDNRTRVLHHAGVAVELQIALRVGSYVARDHAYAVGVMPGQVGGNQMVGDKRRFGGGASHMGEKGFNKMMQIRGLEAMSCLH